MTLTPRVIVPGTPEPTRVIPWEVCPCGAVYIGVPDPVIHAAWMAIHGSHEDGEGRGWKRI